MPRTITRSTRPRNPQRHCRSALPRSTPTTRTHHQGRARSLVRSTGYVVIELKHRKLTPANVGQLNFYVAVIDDTMRRAHHAPTVGLLLCSDRNDRAVRYALNASTSPMAVAGYRYNELPLLEQALLPPEDALLDVVGLALGVSDASVTESRVGLS